MHARSRPAELKGVAAAAATDADAVHISVRTLSWGCMITHGGTALLVLGGHHLTPAIAETTADNALAAAAAAACRLI